MKKAMSFFKSTAAVVLSLSVAFMFTACDDDDNGTGGNGNGNGPPDDHVYGTVTDVEGNSYNTVTIGGKTWMAENLKVTSYTDGSLIDNIVGDYPGWSDASVGAYVWYENDESANKSKYGALYNFFAVESGNLCPDGWSVPTEDQWDAMISHVGAQGHSGEEGHALKATSGWESNGNGSNDFGFGAKPGGLRAHAGAYSNAGYHAYFWSATEGAGGGTAIAYNITDGHPGIFDYEYAIRSGFSVRCIKD